MDGRDFDGAGCHVMLVGDLVIPPNATAAVHLPAADAVTVTDGGHPIGEATGVKFVKVDKGASICEFGSGTFGFTSEIAH